MDLEKLNQINDALEALNQKQKYNKIESYFPETGKYSRHNYPQHMEFIEKSQFHKIMGLIGANGSGKSTLGSLFTVVHNTGKYPDYWTGHRFNQGPLTSWVASIEAKQLRTIQTILFGSPLDPGTGMIPKEDLLDDKGRFMMTMLAGTADCVGLCYVRHYNSAGKFDGYSQIEFKTYLQGWEQYQGATIQWAWLDEEPEDSRILAETLARTRNIEGKEGRVLCTFTPTLGWSKVYLSFLPDGKLPLHGVHPDNPQKYAMIIEDNQPHLTDEWKKSMLAEWKHTDPRNILARTKGIAAMGSGMIYPVEEEYYIVKRKDIPDYFPRAFGLDFASSVGQTAAIWVAQDPVTKIKYVYGTYKRTGVHDSMHVLAIQSKGKWIPGICDPHSGRRDGGELRADYYRSLGLDLINGESNPAAGIAMILNDLQNGQLKVMEDCIDLISEIRTYRWDSKHPEKPAEKQDDHLLDALRYLYSKFDYTAKTEDSSWDDYRTDFYDKRMNSSRDDLTGY